MTERHNKHLVLVTPENQEDLSWNEPGEGLTREADDSDSDDSDSYVTDILPACELGGRLRQFDADLNQLSFVEYAFSHTNHSILHLLVTLEDTSKPTIHALDVALNKALEKRLPEFTCTPYMQSANDTTRNLQYEIALTEQRLATVIPFNQVKDGK